MTQRKINYDETINETTTKNIMSTKFIAIQKTKRYEKIRLQRNHKTNTQDNDAMTK